jgi:hypothetical protein
VENRNALEARPRYPPPPPPRRSTVTTRPGSEWQTISLPPILSSEAFGPPEHQRRSF